MQPGPPRRLGLYSESNVITAGVRGTSRESPSANSFQVLMLKSFRQESQRFQMWALISKAAGEAWNNPSPLPKSSVYSSMETKAALKNSGLINPLFTAAQLKNNPPPQALPSTPSRETIYHAALKNSRVTRCLQRSGLKQSHPTFLSFQGKKASMQTIRF